MNEEEKRFYELFKDRGTLPPRVLEFVGVGKSAEVGNNGVAVSGNGGTATVGLAGAAIGGDGATAKCGGMVALAGENALASVGDGSMARVGYRGRAVGELASVAYVHPAGWALSKQIGIAIALGGLAETAVEGIAAAYSHFAENEHWRAIAIAGPGGIAVAMTEGSFVQAGVGGVLLGIWPDGGKIKQVAVHPIESEEDACAIYRFAKGKFARVVGEDLASAAADMAKWRNAGPKPPPREFEEEDDASATRRDDLGT